MFVHPATHHFSRTYTSQNAGHPTTSRKNLNKENAGALPSKTPSRMTAKGMVPNTSIRVGLGVKSTVKDGNVQNGGNGDGKGKGKDEDIAPKRLFTSQASSSKSTLPPSKSLSSLPAINALPTRTPAARRQAPANLRTPAPPVFEPPTPLPSASRTRRRSRQSLTPIKADPTEFKTPARSAKWEEEISMGSIEVGAELEEVVEVDEGDGDDELEYMPPPMPELPPEPPFEHADLKQAFGILANVPPLWRIGYAVIEVPELVPDFEPQQDVQLLDDEMLEEPMFRFPKPDVVKAAPSVAAAGKPTRGRLASKTTSLNGGTGPSVSRHAAIRAPGPSVGPARTMQKTGPALSAAPASNGPAAAARRPLGTAPRPDAVRPTSGPSKGMPALSARITATAARIPQTAYLAKPRPAGGAARMTPSAARTDAATTSAPRGPTHKPQTVKPDGRPIIKIDVPVMDFADELEVEPDFTFHLSLGSDDEGLESAGRDTKEPEERSHKPVTQLSAVCEESGDSA